MTIEGERFFRAIDQKPDSLLAQTLLSLEALYAHGLSVYLFAERIGVRSRRRLPVPIISIGNLSVGGTGKSPAVISVALALQGLGYRVVVLSRGHGGTLSRKGAIISDLDGNLMANVRESGDEPLMLAKALFGIPVVVGKDRRISGALAISEYKPDILLLDDGFQYWQLHRDLDIVLLDSRRPFENGHCLPRGLLREPMANLRRAGIILFTRSSGLTESERESLIAQAESLAPKAQVYFAEHSPGALRPVNTPAKDQVEPPLRGVLVSALARPESFLRTVADAGIEALSVMTYSDHHRYSTKDAKDIVGKMNQVSADAIITTDKDSVKLEELLPDIPVFSQGIQFSIRNLSGFLTTLLTGAGLPTESAQEQAALC